MSKNKIIQIQYKNIDLIVTYYVANYSYSDEFSTVNLPDTAEVCEVFVQKTNINELLNDNQIEEIQSIINAKRGK